MAEELERLAKAAPLREIIAFLADGYTERVIRKDGKWVDEHGREFESLDQWSFHVAFVDQVRG